MIGFNDDFIRSVHGFTPDQKLRLVENAGGSVLRTSLDWRSLEPVRDQWDEAAWDAVAELYRLASQRDARLIFAIGYAPAWAREPGGACGVGSGPGLGRCELPPRRSMDPEWEEFAGEVARRFPRALIEVWNEPNFTPFWRSEPDPERYADLFLEAARAIKKSSPESDVLLAGLLNLKGSSGQGMPIDLFLGRVLEAGPEIGSLTAGINIHPYPGGKDLGAGSEFMRSFDQARRVRDDFGLAEIPIYVTEVGVSTGGRDDVTLRQQAETMTQVLSLSREMPDVRAVLFHRLLSPADSTEDPWELGVSWLLPGSFPPEPRPVYCEFVAMAQRTYPGC